MGVETQLCVNANASVARVPGPAAGATPPLSLASTERLITLLATNDIHGGVEPTIDPQGGRSGGMSLWAGIATATRQGLAQKFGDSAGVLTLDAGDQFQGTLISNYNEGQLVFAAMNEVGYDAVITGNHDYDFGPIGWLDDQVTPQTADQNPRGALERVAGQASFPILSSNTFFKSSLVDSSGRAVQVDGNGCRPAAGSAAIDWSKAKSPGFLKPYLIKTVAGVRVALVGVDNPSTPTTTTPANVSDLCFADEAETYLRVRAQLEGQADVFVMIVHDGNAGNVLGESQTVQKILAANPAAVDAVIAGHTHYVNNVRLGSRNVPLIQSGSGGTMFGRIDLVYDTQARQLEPQRTRVFAGVTMYPDRCAPGAQGAICSVDPASGAVSYEGVAVQPDAAVDALIAQARAQVSPIAGRKLGTADAVITVARQDESPLADALTDAMRSVSGADIAFLNTGGLRAPLPAGDVTYEDLFKVLPFNNHGLIVGPMGADKVLSLLARSAKSCGQYGPLMQSGLRVTFQRDCAGVGAATGVDSGAKLLHVETLDGEVVLDAASGVVPPSGRTFNVATLDFLAAGGAGFTDFGGVPVIEDFGIVREALADYFTQNPASFTAQTDGRWKVAAPPAGP